MAEGETTFSIHNVKIKCKPGVTYTLIPFGDVHRDSRLCSRERWLEFLSWAKKTPNCFFLGMGDYLDLSSFSERKSLRCSNLHESTHQTLEDLYDKGVDLLAEELDFAKGKFIGLLEGNHYSEYSSGITTTQKLCERLKARYLGISSFIRLSFEYGTRRASIDILSHHGKGGAGRYVGSDINHIQAMQEIGEAQIYLMGHTHKKSVAMKTRLCLSSGNSSLDVVHKKIVFVRTGSFLKGYEPGVPSYAVRRCLNPTDLGVVKIQLTPIRKMNKGLESFYIDIHGSI